MDKKQYIRIDVGRSNETAKAVATALRVLGYKNVDTSEAAVLSGQKFAAQSYAVPTVGSERTLTYTTTKWFKETRDVTYADIEAIGLDEDKPVTVRVGDYVAKVDKKAQTVTVDGIVIPASTVKAIAEALRK